MQQGVIQQFLHPPIGLCSLEEITTTHSGEAVYQRIRGPVNVDAFGINVLVTDWPAGYGFDERGVALRFDRTMIIIDVLHDLFDASQLFTDQVETNLGTTTLMFSESFPRSCTVWTPPGVTATVSWLLLLGS
jgi:hypothetical protein